MPPAKIRVLVVDDSRLLRQIIVDSLAAIPNIQVVGEAGDGEEALRLIRRLNPDVVTLDIQMPQMDGIATLDAIMAERPVPVVMVSSLTQRGAEVTFEALARGALDYVPKPEGTGAGRAFPAELVRKIRLAAGADVPRILEIRRSRAKRSRTPACPAHKPSSIASRQTLGGCVVIGISTGGPPALASLFERLQPPVPPIVVVQHMPAGFTKPFAWRLNSLSPLSIKEAEEGDLLEPNLVLIAPGGRHLRLRRCGPQVRAVLDDAPPVSGHRPSVDVLMRSAVELFGANTLGVIMTGMGHDGVAGCQAIRREGGYVLGQDEASSEVYGMNKVAFVHGHVDAQFSLPDAAEAITHRLHIARNTRRQLSAV
jgi:two-component system chemotaxis response regulator CheB